ncbi:multicopper oxidase domain-containing protein, partial [Leptospira sp. 96542]|nr:multicopper oxidase domain-containing protein [Leptospira sp. 96542]
NVDIAHSVSYPAWTFDGVVPGPVLRANLGDTLKIMVKNSSPDFAQSIQLGLTPIVVSFTVNLAIALSAARLATWFARSPRWLAAQRYLMGSVLAALAAKMVLEPRRAV